MAKKQESKKKDTSIYPLYTPNPVYTGFFYAPSFYLQSIAIYLQSKDYKILSIHGWLVSHNHQRPRECFKTVSAQCFDVAFLYFRLNYYIIMYTKFWLLVVLVLAQITLFAQKQLIEVAYLPLGALNAEDKAAISFLQQQNSLKAYQIKLSDLGSNPNLLQEIDVIWIHGSDTSLNTTFSFTVQQAKILLEAVNNGKGLLLSNYAAKALNILNLENIQISTRAKQASDNGYGRMLGFHAYRNHPIFDGLNGGAYLLKPKRNISVQQTGFFNETIPSGKVVATDWDYIFLREQSKLVMEYAHGSGKVLAVGGYMLFNEPNVNEKHLKLFTINCLNYLAKESNTLNSPTFYWNYNPETVKLLKKSNSIVVPSTIPNTFTIPTQSPLQIHRNSATTNFWDLAGERLLVMGTQQGGIEEVWAHPFMALRDLKTHIIQHGNKLPILLDSLNPSILVTPEALIRTYKVYKGMLTECIMVSPTQPVLDIHYKYEGELPIQLSIHYSSHLRLMWPYSDKVPNSISCTSDSATAITTITDESGDFNVLTGSSTKPYYTDFGQFDGFKFNDTANAFKGIPTLAKRVSVLQNYTLFPNQSLDFVVAAAQEPLPFLQDIFVNTLQYPNKIYDQNLARSLDVAQTKLQIISPDSEFNEAYKWALRSTDAFYVHTPGIGKSLVAGYSTTATGWDGEHTISGRPGYAWYFGRDAEWSAFALLGYGDYQKVKEVILTLSRFQDLNGKIFHELSTSGFAHYDASDATPLYLVLVGNYLRYSGDTAFIHRQWPSIYKAYQFCLSTDTDADHLIENTNVGHGWVEGGYLFGSHTSLYLASCWAAALQAMESLALCCNQPEVTANCANEYRIVVDKINRHYWNPVTQYYYHGMFKDGSFHQEPSVMPAIPMLFKQADSTLASKVLPVLASNQYSTNWGCRIVSENSPAFKPTGYHTGSVWPLFTGWVSLAEYAYNMPESGYAHMLNNLLVYKNWGLGFVEEVINGKVYEPSGVCRHQCWSETMSIQPAIDGMLGYKPDAVSAKVQLAPSIPASWDSLKVNNLRCGQSCFNFSMIKREGRISYEFQLVSGPAIDLQFQPFFECFSVIKSVMSGQSLVPYTIKDMNPFQQLLLNFDLTKTLSLEIEYERGIQINPFKYDPSPGSSPEGIRIVRTGRENGFYFVDLESLANTEGVISIAVPSNFQGVVKQAEIVCKVNNELLCKVHFGATISKYFVQRVYIKP